MHISVCMLYLFIHLTYLFIHSFIFLKVCSFILPCHREEFKQLDQGTWCVCVRVHVHTDT